MWAVVLVTMVGVQLVLVFVVLSKRDHEAEDVAGGDGPTSTTSSTTTLPGPSVPVAVEPIPGVGGDVFIGGGVTRVPVTGGWQLLVRADRDDAPGGYSEAAVLTHPASALRAGVYMRSESLPEGREAKVSAVTTAEDAARTWVSDGVDARFETPKEEPPVGALAGVASVRYHYDLGSGQEGEALVLVRTDGTTIIVFVDAPTGSLDATHGDWLGWRDAVVADFAT